MRRGRRGAAPLAGAVGSSAVARRRRRRRTTWRSTWPSSVATISARSTRPSADLGCPVGPEVCGNGCDDDCNGYTDDDDPACTSQLLVTLALGSGVVADDPGAQAARGGARRQPRGGGGMATYTGVRDGGVHRLRLGHAELDRVPIGGGSITSRTRRTRRATCACSTASSSWSIRGRRRQRLSASLRARRDDRDRHGRGPTISDRLLVRRNRAVRLGARVDRAERHPRVHQERDRPRRQRPHPRAAGRAPELRYDRLVDLGVRQEERTIRRAVHDGACGTEGDADGALRARRRRPARGSMVASGTAPASSCLDLRGADGTLPALPWRRRTP